MTDDQSTPLRQRAQGNQSVSPSLSRPIARNLRNDSMPAPSTSQAFVPVARRISSPSSDASDSLDGEFRRASVGPLPWTPNIVHGNTRSIDSPRNPSLGNGDVHNQQVEITTGKRGFRRAKECGEDYLNTFFESDSPSPRSVTSVNRKNITAEKNSSSDDCIWEATNIAPQESGDSLCDPFGRHNHKSQMPHSVSGLRGTVKHEQQGTSGSDKENGLSSSPSSFQSFGGMRLTSRATSVESSGISRRHHAHGNDDSAVVHADVLSDISSKDKCSDDEGARRSGQNTQSRQSNFAELSVAEQFSSLLRSIVDRSKRRMLDMYSSLPTRSEPNISPNESRGKHPKHTPHVQTSRLMLVISILVFSGIQIMSLVRHNRELVTRLHRYENTYSSDGQQYDVRKEPGGASNLRPAEVNKKFVGRTTETVKKEKAPGTSSTGKTATAKKHMEDKAVIRTKTPDAKNQENIQSNSRDKSIPKKQEKIATPSLNLVQMAEKAASETEKGPSEERKNVQEIKETNEGKVENSDSVAIPERYENLANFPSELSGLNSIFWHIPKSGGSTVKDTICQCMGLTLASEVGGIPAHVNDKTLQVFERGTNKFLNVDTTTPHGLEKAKRLGLASSGLADVIITPYPYEASALFTPEHKGMMFAVFRNPIDRAVSMFYYLSKATWEPTYDPSLADLTLEEYARGGRIENNWMTRFLTNEMTGEVTESHLKIAKEIVGEKILVGLLDKTVESFRRFHTYFGWDLEEKDQLPARIKCMKKLLIGGVNRNNRTASAVTVEEGSEAYHLLLWQNKYDMELYKHAVEIFELQAHFFE